jgi:hypothetical protein
MKKNQTHAPDCTRIKRLLKDLKTNVRRSLSGQVFSGGELKNIKNRLGFSGSGRRTKESRQSGDFNSWGQFCEEFLQIPGRSADRFIQVFESARARALARKNAAAREERAEDFALWERVCVLMDSPSAELTGGELDELAGHVHDLVDHDTQAGLLEELGIKAPQVLKRNGSGNTQPEDDEIDLQASLEQQALVFFASIPRKIDKLKKDILGLRDFGSYQIFLSHLPLEDGRDGKPSLMGIKEGLEEILRNGSKIV